VCVWLLNVCYKRIATERRACTQTQPQDRPFANGILCTYTQERAFHSHELRVSPVTIIASPSAQSCTQAQMHKSSQSDRSQPKGMHITLRKLAADLSLEPILGRGPGRCFHLNGSHWSEEHHLSGPSMLPIQLQSKDGCRLLWPRYAVRDRIRAWHR